MRQLEFHVKEVVSESEGPKIIELDKVIVKDFFKNKRRALKSCFTEKMITRTGLRIRLTNDNSGFSDKDTEESHCCTSRSAKSARNN